MKILSNLGLSLLVTSIVAPGLAKADCTTLIRQLLQKPKYSNCSLAENLQGLDGKVNMQITYRPISIGKQANGKGIYEFRVYAETEDHEKNKSTYQLFDLKASSDKIYFNEIASSNTFKCDGNKLFVSIKDADLKQKAEKKINIEISPETNEIHILRIAGDGAGKNGVNWSEGITCVKAAVGK